jgi:hypothetical protein
MLVTAVSTNSRNATQPQPQPQPTRSYYANKKSLSTGDPENSGFSKMQLGVRQISSPDWDNTEKNKHT